MPQTGPDLVSGGYPISRPLTALLGGTAQTASPNFPARTNLEFFSGLSIADTTAPSIMSSGVALATPVPVVPGDVFTRVTILTGAQSVAANAHAWAGLYTGVPFTSAGSPALIGQTIDVTASGAPVAGAVGSSGAFTMSFSSATTITALHAPYGYIYVSLGELAASGSVYAPLNVSAGSVACGQWVKAFTTAPAFNAATHGTSLSAAPASITAVTNVTQAPVVVLS